MPQPPRRQTRRRWIATLMAAAASLTMLPAAHAAQPVVEIIAFAHPPVLSALKPLRDWLAAQGSKVKVVEIDLETPAGEKRLQAVGVTGHVPVVVLIDGQHRHQRADGSAVGFVVSRLARYTTGCQGRLVRRGCGGDPETAPEMRSRHIQGALT
jgi:hypothetical protein